MRPTHYDAHPEPESEDPLKLEYPNVEAKWSLNELRKIIKETLMTDGR